MSVLINLSLIGKIKTRFLFKSFLKPRKLTFQCVWMLMTFACVSFILGLWICWQGLDRAPHPKLNKPAVHFAGQAQSNSIDKLNLPLAAVERSNEFGKPLAVGLRQTKPWTELQMQVKRAVQNSFQAYRKYAWGRDHLMPISKAGEDWFGLGLTIVDGLDTFLLMDMQDEYRASLDWIKSSLSFDRDVAVNCFETTIRMLGGLISAYHLTGEAVLYDKAYDLGDRLLHCFDNSIPVPYSDVKLNERTPRFLAESSTSEVSSLQIEFRELSILANESRLIEAPERTSQHLHDQVQARNDPLVPFYISPSTGRFLSSMITLGARADSYYEYLLKQYFQTGRSQFELDYVRAVQAIQQRLMQTTGGPLALQYPAELFQAGNVNPKMDHLVCFLPGTLVLGWLFNQKRSDRRTRRLLGRPADHIYAEHKLLSEQIARTCAYTYNTTQTGLAPEITHFALDPSQPNELYVKDADAHNLLRPEYVESLYYLYHATKDPQYRQQGAAILDAFDRYCRVETGGYTSIGDVRLAANPRPRDKMESFWIAETLKYLFLLFSDDQTLIDRLMYDFVFNTEAHLFPIRTK